MAVIIDRTGQSGSANQARVPIMSEAFAHLVVLSDSAGCGLPIIGLGGRRETRLLAMYNEHAIN